ncbi:cytochrome P450 family protein [Jeotgalibacillus campisalis]|uniref:Cytochrome P450 n=1 Tax=Jeotgalibacillus campisalis TaxID=220754 RepID=A0A0C2W2X0_9BACL|nr:cytochrome P450 [Jeotgalibacillus campisalis]KIL50961.1 cytochrome P450 [Jeotgalibacillus campisalis]
METMETIYTSNFKVGAYDFYRHLRQSDAVFAMNQQNGQTSWVITKYDHVKELLKSPNFIKDQSKIFVTPEAEGDEGKIIRIFRNMMLDADPPDHTRLRKLVQPFFNPKTIKALEPRMNVIADELISEMKNQKGPVDLITHFAFPLPIIVISEMLGVPVEDRNKFRKWSNTILAASDNLTTDFAQDVEDFIEYLTRLFEERKELPKDDLISKLLQAEADGEKLNRDELYSMVVLLIIAGHETTVNLIANTMYALFQHPDQLKAVQEDHSLIESAIEEGLRFYSPVDFSTARWSEEEMEFHGKTFKRGDFVLASLSSANRDEEKFSDAETFDVTREQAGHMAFGFGIHFCLGAPLARLEGKIALNSLLSAFPSIRMAGQEQPEWINQFLLRGLKELNVHL